MKWFVVQPATSLSLLVALAALLTMGCQQTPRSNLAEQLSRIEQRREKALLLSEQGLEAEDPSHRRELLSRAVEMDPMLGPAQNNLGVVLFEQGEYYQAAKHLRQAANLMNASPGPWANLAVLHAELSQWHRAEEYAREARERDGSDPLSLRVLARALSETGEDESELKRVLEKLALRDPSEAWRQWAIANQKALIDRQPIWE